MCARAWGGRPRKVKKRKDVTMGLELKVENLGGHGPVQYLARTPWIRYAGDEVRARDIIHPSTPSPPEAQQTAILRPIYSVRVRGGVRSHVRFHGS